MESIQKRVLSFLVICSLFITMFPISTLAAAPAVTITSPSGNGWVTTLTPNITWDFSDPDNDSQKSYRIVVTKGGTPVFDTGTLSLSSSVQTIALPSDGQYDVALTVTDSNNESTTADQTIKVDRTPPNMSDPTIIQMLPAVSSGWGKENVQVTIDNSKITDNGSGVKEIEYLLTGATQQNWSIYTAPFVISNDGITYITIRATDYAGNEATSSATVKLDKTPPSKPTIQILQSNWTSQNMTFSVSPGTDFGSGIQKVQYKIGEAGEWIDYNSPVTISTQGQTIIYARSIDNVGNISETESRTISIDKTPPTAPTIQSSNSDWTNQDVTITLTGGTDAESGIEKIQYMFGSGGAWIDYGGPFKINFEGQTDVFARAIDKAGNISSVVSLTAAAKIDRTPPSIPSIQVNPQTVSNQNVTFMINSGSDSGSGVLKSQYKLGAAGSWTDYTGQVTLTGDGQIVIYARTIDRAGNISASAAATVDVKKTNPYAPVIQLSNSNWTNSSVFVSIVGGAGGRIEYKIGQSGTWTTYNSPFTISAEGQTEIFARSFDKDGKESTSSSAVVKIDRTAPTAPSFWLSEWGWTRNNVTFVVSNGTDLLSGVQKSQYRIGTNGNWIDYSAPVTISTVGETVVYFRTVDYAGNASPLAQTYIRIYRDSSDFLNNPYPTWPNISVEYRADESKVEITWTGQPRGYDIAVHRDGIQKIRTIGDSFTDTDVKPGKTYRYDVYIINSGQYFNVNSKQVTIPYPKLNVSVANNIGKVTESSIEFKLPKVDNVERYLVKSPNGTVYYNDRNPNFILQNLLSGTLYTFELSYTIGGVSSETTTLTVNTLGPGNKPVTDPQKPTENGTGRGADTFTDIDGVFSNEEIKELSKLGIIHGVTSTRFEPYRNVTRAEFMALVVRMTSLKADRPYNGTFTDVDPEDWFYHELEVALQHGFITGKSPTTFAPNDPVTREQAATIIGRMFRNPDYSSVKAHIYRDQNEISEYAKTHVQLLESKGIMTGYQDNTFRPQQPLSRAEAAAILYRLLNK